MSDTPRTDAAEEMDPLEWEQTHSYKGRTIVPADFARQLERDLAAANAENAKLRKNCEAMAECKALADGMANMIRGFIFKTVERETLDEVAAKYRKWEEDYCHRTWRAKQ